MKQKKTVPNIPAAAEFQSEYMITYNHERMESLELKSGQNKKDMCP